MTAAQAPKHSERRRRRPSLALVRGSRRTLRVTTVAISVLALLVLFGIVGFQALIVRNQGAIDSLDDRIEEATRANQRLRLAVAELESPERIREAAITALGMVEPDEVVYLEPIAAEQLLVPGQARPAADGDS